MIKNYLITAVRNIKKHKTLSTINILGLAVGMTSCILILFYIMHEISYDRFNSNYNNIYRIVTEKKTAGGKINDASTPPALAPALIGGFPGIAGSVRFLNVDNPAPLVVFGGKRFYEKGFYFADQNMFDLFTIPFISGDPAAALKEPNTVVVSETTADKYFGNLNPVGKTLRFNNQLDLKITGVIKNLPANSTIKGDIFVSFSTLHSWLGKDFVDSWQNNMYETYVLLKDGIAFSSLEQSMPAFVDKNIGKANSIKNIFLQPLGRIHLYSNNDYNMAAEGDITYIYSLAAIALFILIIACFNYLNLRASQMVHRFKEMGIRKALGATTRQLAAQLFIEGVFYTALAFVAAILIISSFFPYINDFAGLTGMTNMLIWPAVFVFLVGLLFGSYPVLLLKFAKPVKKNKVRFKIAGFELTTGKILVLTQFALTNFLIIGSLVILNQLDYVHNKKLGLDGDQVVIVPIRDEGLRQDQTLLKTRLQKTAGIHEIGASALLPGGPVGKTKYQIDGHPEQGTMAMLWVDHNFIKTLGIEIAAGRGFSTQYSTDASEAFVINEEAVKKLGFAKPEEALNRQFELAGGKKGQIIGVVKDFHFASMQKKIEPLVMHIWPWLNYLLVRFDPPQAVSVINEIKTAMNEISPGYPFEYKFLSDNFNKYYERENKLKDVSVVFTIIALLLAAFGLFSLSANVLERKTKEITIRKVLGASAAGIFCGQIGEFALLLLSALIAASPAAYFIMTGWLNNYAYHIGISVNIFISAFSVSFVMLFLMAGYHAYKAAGTNPADSLRYE